MIGRLSPLWVCALSLVAMSAGAAAPDNLLTAISELTNQGVRNLPTAISELRNQDIRKAIVGSARRLTAEGRAAIGRAIVVCRLPSDAGNKIASRKLDAVAFNAACEDAYYGLKQRYVSSGSVQFFSYVSLEKRSAEIMTSPDTQLLFTSTAVDRSTMATFKEMLAEQSLDADMLKEVLEDSVQ